MNEKETSRGYLHPAYAQSLGEFGEPWPLMRSEGWILQRRIHGCDRRDAMGCYPVFACRDWSQLEADLEDLGNSLVSLSLVTDPFGEYDMELLRHCFRNVVVPFKEHLVVDLSSKTDRTSRHHRYYARRALRHVAVEKCDEPQEHLDDWLRLYEILVSRHNLTGIKRFSRASFEQQLAVPGIVMFRATRAGMTVGAHIWYVQDSVAYSHLQATDEKGYEVRAAYALYSKALEWLRSHVSLADLGSGAGAERKSNDGLVDFKRGWATGTRQTYFCGRVFDPAAYDQLTQGRGISELEHFPAYRAGEFR